MTWIEVAVPALRLGLPIVAVVRHTVTDACAVEVNLESQLVAHASGPDLFEALVAVRRDLERRGVLLGCNGCRRDVFPSQMLRQAANGRRAYVLTLPRTPVKPPTVDIFDPVSDLTAVATVDEQRAWFDRWSSGHGPHVETSR